MPLYTRGTGRAAINNPGEHAAVAAWVATVVAAGGTVSAGLRADVNTLIKALDFSGVWADTLRLVLFTNETTQGALIDIKALVAATVTGSPVFTANAGYAGVSGSGSDYIGLGFNPSTDGLLQNDCHLGVWQNNNLAALNQCQIGINAASTFAIHTEFGDGNAYYDANNSLGGAVIAASSDGTGFHLVNRIAASGAGAVEAFKNNSSVGTSTAASVSPANAELYALTRNPAGDNAGSAAQVSIVTIGNSLDASQRLAQYNAFTAYRTARGL